jgi:hypothetical protein
MTLAEFEAQPTIKSWLEDLPKSRNTAAVHLRQLDPALTASRR